MARVVTSRRNSVAMSPLVSTTYDRRNQIYIRHSFSRFWQLWVYWYNITYSTHQYTYTYMLFIYQRFYAILRQILTITQTKARGLAYCSAGKHSRWQPAPTKRRRLTSCAGLLFWEAGRTCLVMALMLNWKRRPIMTVWCKLWLPLCTARKDWKSMRNWYNTIPCYWLHTIAIYYNILFFNNILLLSITIGLFWPQPRCSDQE